MLILFASATLLWRKHSVQWMGAWSWAASPSYDIRKCPDTSINISFSSLLYIQKINLPKPINFVLVLSLEGLDRDIYVYPHLIFSNPQQAFSLQHFLGTSLSTPKSLPVRSCSPWGGERPATGAKTRAAEWFHELWGCSGDPAQLCCFLGACGWLLLHNLSR